MTPKPRAYDVARLPDWLQTLRMQLANKVADATLECTVCGTRVTVTANLGAHFLTSGWPKCCGETMSLVTR